MVCMKLFIYIMFGVGRFLSCFVVSMFWVSRLVFIGLLNLVIKGISSICFWLVISVVGFSVVVILF